MSHTVVSQATHDTDRQWLPDPLGPYDEDFRRLHLHWPWLVVLGVVVTIAGLGAVAYSTAATLTTVLIVGVIALVGGATQVVSALLVRSWRGFFIYALIGILHVLVGGFMIEHPLRAAAVVTLVLAVTFLIGGAARLIHAATHRVPGRWWVLLNGAVTFLLGLSIWQGWPEASLWVIGVVVGIDLAFSGWSLVTLGFAVKAARRAPAEAT